MQQEFCVATEKIETTLRSYHTEYNPQRDINTKFRTIKAIPSNSKNNGG